MVPPTRTPVQVTESMRGPRGPQGASPVKPAPLVKLALPVLPAPAFCRRSCWC